MLQAGDVWTGRVEIRDPSGVLADAGAVTLTATAPGGTITPLGVAHPSTGVYTASWPVDAPGRWLMRWVATGANQSTWTDVVDVADPALAPLVSLAEIRAHMGWSASTDAAGRARDAQAVALADGMTELVESYCGQRFRRSVVEHVHAGGGAAVLLAELPATEIVSVVDGGTTLDPSAYRLSAAGVLYRRSGAWGETVITYRTGPAVPPEPVRLAVLRLVEHHWQETRQGPHPLGGQPTGYDEQQPAQTWALPYAIQSLISAYRVSGIA